MKVRVIKGVVADSESADYVLIEVSEFCRIITARISHADLLVLGSSLCELAGLSNYNHPACYEFEYSEGVNNGDRA